MARLSITVMAALLTMTAGERPAEHYESSALNVHGDDSEGTKAQTSGDENIEGTAVVGASRVKTEGNEAVVDPTVQVKINFWLTRHAFSCANAAKYFPGTGLTKATHILLQDPLLTQCGAYNSRTLRGALRQAGSPDIVLSSHLLRAIETAIFMYGVEGGRKVTPVPYISEEGFGLDNRKFDSETQKRIVEANAKRYSDSVEEHTTPINWDWVDNPAYAGGTAPDWGKFLQFMGGKFLPQHFKSQGGPPAKELTIAVVTHSGLMKSIVKLVDKEVAERAKKAGASEKPGPCTAAFGGQVEGGKPNVKNNQVLRLTFEYAYDADRESGKLSLDSAGALCELLLNDEIRGQPKTLCKRDAQCSMAYSFLPYLDDDAWIKTVVETDGVQCCIPAEGN